MTAARKIMLPMQTHGASAPTTTCPACHGLGRVFACPEWEQSRGECCPDGTIREGCPGKSLACARCGGTGRV